VRLMVTQSVTKYFAFYVAPGFITILTNVRCSSLTSSVSFAQSNTHYLFNIRLTVILPSVSRTI